MSQDAEHKSAFFRQSGWLMIANLVAGALMFPPTQPLGLAIGVIVVLVGISVAALREHRRRA